MLQIAKNGQLLLEVSSFGFSRIFFHKSSPPSDFVPVGDRRGPKILSPPIKDLEKKPCPKTPFLCVSTPFNLF